jgi:hypothetical protein
MNYTNYLTSEIVVPSIFKPFEKFKQIVEHDYKIFIPPADYNLIRDILYDEYVKHSLQYKHNQSIFNIQNNSDLCYGNLNFQF